MEDMGYGACSSEETVTQILRDVPDIGIRPIP
jgi:hypothetical protein